MMGQHLHTSGALPTSREACSSHGGISEPLDVQTISSDTVHSTIAPMDNEPSKQSESPFIFADESREPPSESIVEKPHTYLHTKLSSHKHHGTNQPTLVHMKHKPQFTRMYSNDMYAAEDTPFFGVLTKTSSKSVAEVQMEMDSQLDSIVQVYT